MSEQHSQKNCGFDLGWIDWLSGVEMLQAGRIVNDPGSRARCVPTSYTKDEIHEVMCDVGKAFVVKKIDWDSNTGEAVIHLEPSNGVEWEFYLVRSR